MHGLPLRTPLRSRPAHDDCDRRLVRAGRVAGSGAPAPSRVRRHPVGGRLRMVRGNAAPAARGHARRSPGRPARALRGRLPAACGLGVVRAGRRASACTRAAAQTLPRHARAGARRLRLPLRRARRVHRLVRRADPARSALLLERRLFLVGDRVRAPASSCMRRGGARAEASGSSSRHSWASECRCSRTEPTCCSERCRGRGTRRRSRSGSRPRCSGCESST